MINIKRLIDLLVSLILLILFSPLFFLLIWIILIDDFKNPFYISNRVGYKGRLFKMIKFRSMRPIKSLNNVVSTSDNDPRITKVGRFIRKFKIDELSQLINVFIGNMSLVGPRPNVLVEVNLYSKIEKKILNVKPGITDFSSLIFSDLNEILSNSKNPNLKYNQIVRPWKSRLALFYVENKGLFIDISILVITFISLFSRTFVLKLINLILTRYKAPQRLISVCKRDKSLYPFPPPGKKYIVKNYPTI